MRVIRREILWRIPASVREGVTREAAKHTESSCVASSGFEEEIHERTERGPFAWLRYFAELYASPGPECQSETASSHGEDGFVETVRIGKKGGIMGLACVFDHVANHEFRRLDLADVDNVRPVRGFQPCVAESLLGNVATFSENVEVGVPTLGSGRPLDFAKCDATLLGFAPELGPTELRKTRIELVQQVLERFVSRAESEGNEAGDLRSQTVFDVVGDDS